ncbi:hypothetical protein GGS23DRAFT_198657 [Durotheca rogersii]|uniref:uncharacterized protein n=1 Tax=Durotheca rogersii TaxID=419775 RepID=UPI002220377A|nr:uncharacterized protein GGS23DRAFT_198657 [Durotheca rogersii]KAI5867822.1 hypothetical protein GGS23DRAFT_198657 [Durotheca rogersii]
MGVRNLAFNSPIRRGAHFRKFATSGQKLRFLHRQSGVYSPRRCSKKHMPAHTFHTAYSSTRVEQGETRRFDKAIGVATTNRESLAGLPVNSKAVIIGGRDLVGVLAGAPPPRRVRFRNSFVNSTVRYEGDRVPDVIHTAPRLLWFTHYRHAISHTRKTPQTPRGRRRGDVFNPGHAPDAPAPRSRARLEVPYLPFSPAASGEEEGGNRAGPPTAPTGRHIHREHLLIANSRRSEMARAPDICRPRPAQPSPVRFLCARSQHASWLYAYAVSRGSGISRLCPRFFFAASPSDLARQMPQGDVRTRLHDAARKCRPT